MNVNSLPYRVLILISISLFACPIRVIVADNGLRDAVIDAESSEPAAHAYRSLFTAFDAESLVLDSNLGISLHAYWRTSNVIMQMRSGEPDGKPLAPFSNPIPRSESHTSRFLGFFEGRTGLHLPFFWEEAIAHDVTSQEAEYETDFLQEKTRLKPAAFKGLKFSSHVLEASLDADVVVFSIDGRRTDVRIPTQAFDVSDDLANTCAIAAQDDLVVVVIFRRDISSRYHIRCLHATSGKLLWQNLGWACGHEGGSGPGYHHLRVTFQGTTAVVFGETATGRYAEAYGLDTGAARFRFSTNYWNAWHAP